MGAAGKFSCDECSRSYTWKAELAGRRVKCKCGHAMTVPREDPSAAEAVEPAGFDDLYALAQGAPVETAPVTPPAYGGGGGGVCPSCGQATAAGAVICVGCGHNLKTGKKIKTQKVVVEGGGGGGAGGMLAYAGRRPGRDDDDGARGGDMFINPVTDLYIPMACILVGTLLSYFEVVYGHNVRNPGMAIMYVGISTLITILVGVPGVLTTVKMFDLGLGPLGPGLLKIIACLLLPGAVGGVIIAFVPMGGALAWIVSFAITVVMFMKMLEMDYTETVICSMIIWLIRTWGTFALMALIFGAFFGGGGGKSGSSKALQFAAGGQMEDVESSADIRKERDARVDDILANSTTAEAKSWLAENPEREFRGQEHDKAVGIVNELYGMGAKDVQVVHYRHDKDPDEAVGQVVVMLPTKDKGARKKLFTYQKRMLRKSDEDEEDADDDVGQKAIVLMFTGTTKNELNKQFEAMKAQSKLIEGREWIYEVVGRVVQNHDHQQSPQLIDDLYYAGAERVETVWGKEQSINEPCRHILITLPKDPATRRKIFMVPKNYEEIPKDFVAEKDIGQKYLMLTYWPHR